MIVSEKMGSIMQNKESMDKAIEDLEHFLNMAINSLKWYKVTDDRSMLSRCEKYVMIASNNLDTLIIGGDKNE